MSFLIILLLSAVTAAKDVPSSMFVFGDSISAGLDPNYKKTGWPPPDVYHEGRLSNGPVWVEYLSKDLNLTLHNYAMGGATMKSNTSYWGPFPMSNRNMKW